MRVALNRFWCSVRHASHEHDFAPGAVTGRFVVTVERGKLELLGQHPASTCMDFAFMEGRTQLGAEAYDGEMMGTYRFT